jgi:hypothetical protein
VHWFLGKIDFMGCEFSKTLISTQIWLFQEGENTGRTENQFYVTKEIL